MKKSPKKAPLNVESRAELKRYRRQDRLHRRRRDDMDRKSYREGQKKRFTVEMVRWILNRCDRIQVLGDYWRMCVWVFKGMIVAEWKANLSGPSGLRMRGFRAYHDKVYLDGIHFRPEDFGRKTPDVNVRKKQPTRFGY